MANNKIKVKAVAKKKPIKPKMGKGTGGIITASIIAKAKKDKQNG